MMKRTQLWHIYASTNVAKIFNQLQTLVFGDLQLRYGKRRDRLYLKVYLHKTLNNDAQ